MKNKQLTPPKREFQYYRGQEGVENLQDFLERIEWQRNKGGNGGSSHGKAEETMEAALKWRRGGSFMVEGEERVTV